MGTYVACVGRQKFFQFFFFFYIFLGFFCLHVFVLHCISDKNVRDKYYKTIYDIYSKYGLQKFNMREEIYEKTRVIINFDSLSK